MGMEKQKVIQSFKAGHEKMKDVMQGLTKKQMVEEKVLGDWSVKDILAHLSAWSWEAIEEINRVLQNKASWHRLDIEKDWTDRFNQMEIAKRRKRSLRAVIDEWEKSFQAEIARLEQLTKEDWFHQSGQDRWENGTPVTVHSLYDYEYQGENHEAGHAKEIKRHFSLK